LSAILIALFITLSFADPARAGAIWLEWDRSPDPSVIGYRVSVGSSPGVYTQTFDVGSTTSFIYQAPESRLYYLAVASYAAGPRIGPLSPPITAVPLNPPAGPGPSFPDAHSFYGALWRDVAATSSAAASFRSAQTASTVGRDFSVAKVSASPSTACWASSTDCLTVRTLSRHTAAITSPAASADNRLFFIEDNQRIRMIASNVLQSAAVLMADSAGVQFDQLVLDPAFARTALIYVGQTETHADGTRQFRVVRYRIMGNQAGQPTVVLSIPLPSPHGRALFTVSVSGHLYAMIPADGRSPASPYSGMVLQLNIAGTGPFGEPGAPAAVAAGYANPTAITFDEYSQRVWLAGVDEWNQSSVASLGGSVSRASAVVTSLIGAADHMFLSTAHGGLVRAQRAPSGTIVNAWPLVLERGLVHSAAAAPSGDLFVAVKNETTPDDATTSILQLTPAR
jgi:hypothetical protein